MISIVGKQKELSMSLRPENEDNLYGAHRTMIKILPEDDPMVIFSKEIYPIFQDEDFKECYSNLGKRATSPAFLSMVTLLQFRENMSDDEAREACIRRIDWKIALHVPVEESKCFDASLLCKFRRRLKSNDQSSIIFDKVLEEVKRRGLVKKRTKQRIDATHIIAHVNRISTTDLIFRAVRCVVEEIEKKDNKFYEQQIPDDIKERYGKKFSCFGMNKAKRGEKMAEIIEDGFYIKRLIAEDRSELLKELKQIEIMETIIKENVTIKEKEINEKIFIEAEEIKCPKQTIFDPRDTSLDLGRKGKTSWVGSKCQVVETAEKGKVNFIMGMLYQNARESDQKMHDKLIENNKRYGLKPKKIYTDQNYISGEAINKYGTTNQELLGRITGDHSKKHQDFKLDKFIVDAKKKSAKCPAGKTSNNWGLTKDGDVNIYFSSGDCQRCTKYKDCVTGKREQKRKILINKYYDIIQTRRKDQDTKKFKTEMRIRAQVEGTISEMVRGNGLRYAKYHQKQGHQLQFYLTGAALNTKRLIRVIVKGRKIKA